MKTFAQFIDEGIAKHYAVHYAKSALRKITPGYNVIRQISTQRDIDKFNFHNKIADDDTLSISTRMKHQAKAQKYLEKIAKKIGHPQLADRDEE